MDYDEQLQLIARQLGILQLTNESEYEWKARLIYSIAGRWALASLWDGKSDDVSKKHIKNTIVRCLYTHITLNDKIKKNFGNIQIMAHRIYTLYENTGYFYHYNNYAKAAQYNYSAVKNCLFIRGVSPSENCKMSGLGLYRLSGENVKNGTVSFETMFHISHLPIHVWWVKFLKQRKWKLTQVPCDCEYLYTDRKYSDKYWKNCPDKDGQISLLRWDKQQYHLYRYDGNTMTVSDMLPEWQTWKKEYLRIASAIFSEKGIHPPITVTDRVYAKEIDLGYLLPPSEQIFFELYSWPVDFTFKNEADAKDMQWKGIISSEVYPALKKTVENLGYRIEEK